MNKTPVLERAFQLARTGECANMQEARKLLKAEGYGNSDLLQLTGPTLSAQLRALATQAAQPAKD
jgi:hypothetical protein